MKVLLINNFFYRKGGSEAVFFNTADLLREAGHKVIYFSYKDVESFPCEQEQFFVDHGGKLKQMQSYFYNREAAKKLDALIRKEMPDIAHVHLFWGGISPSIFKVLRKYHVPLVHTAHDYRMVCPAYTFKDGKGHMCERCRRWNYYKCALNCCSKGSFAESTLMTIEMYTRQIFHNPIKNINGFIFVSLFSEEKHIEHHREFKDAKHIVLYNYTKPKLRTDFSSKGDYFLYYGRLSFEKGIPTLLKVFAHNPKLKLKVVGTGPLEELLRAEYDKEITAPVGALEQLKKCYENIQFLGYHSGETLAELVRNAKFVCVPSEWYENNPMTIVESYSLGTPVIGARIGGIPEIINEGKTGYLFESGDVDDLERVVLEANNVSEDDYLLMCDKAYNFYEKNFSAESHYKKLIEFYEEILNDKI